jgi:membrane-associated phospholipid phosphatase
MHALAPSQAIAQEAANGPTYRLDPSIDFPVLVLAGVAAASPLLKSETPAAWCAPSCDPAQVNAFDRWAAGVYRPAWGRVSDVTLGLLFAAPVATLFFDEGFRYATNDWVVIAESIVATSGFASLTSAAVRRPRPYMYGDDAPLDVRKSGDGALSFFSGHTSTAFAASLALYSTLRRRHPNSSIPFVALGTSLATASLVGTSRILAGKHFPTDVIAGAAVGSAMGTLVPALHGAGFTVSTVPIGGSLGVSIGGSW